MATDTTRPAADAAPAGPPSTAADRRHRDGASSADTAAPGAVLRWVLTQQRRSTVLWAVAVAAVSGIYASFYDLMDMGELEAIVGGMPEGLVAALGYDQLGSAAGYLESTIYALLGVVLLVVFAVSNGARLLAGIEEDGVLELEVSSATGRRQVVVERALALVVQVTVLVAVLSAVVASIVAVVDAEVAGTGLVAAGLGLWLFAVAIGSIALAAGAATGRRVVALGIGTGVAVVSYLADALAAIWEDGAWLEAVNPYSWYLAGSPLAEGIDVAGFTGLAVLIVVALTVAVASFERRDLGA
ncbi:MAG: ABC transporter permease subunit [Nitriliruptoraceae bacterium]|nr:ABC transporter permease subunit [Nitriliruptoraceae bacterium]